LFSRTHKHINEEKKALKHTAKNTVQVDKMLISGARIERYTGFVEVFDGRRPKQPGNHLLTPESNVWLKATSVERSARRANSNIRRIVYSNVGRYKDKNGITIPTKFLTLTFAQHITNISEANKYFKRFIQSINREFEDVLVQRIQYCNIVEFTKKGRVHFHTGLFNFPFVHKVFSRIRKHWPDRFTLQTWRTDVNGQQLVGYLTKYVTKQKFDNRFLNQHRFSASRDIFKPVISRDVILNENLAAYLQPWLVHDGKFTGTFGSFSHQLYFLGEGRSINERFIDSDTRDRIKLASQAKFKRFEKSK
jgi:hypothetical protein